MPDTNIAATIPALTTTFVEIAERGIDEALHRGEVLWCSKTPSGTFVASSVPLDLLSQSPAKYLAPGFSDSSLVARVADQAVQIDKSCTALSIMRNSLVLGGIDIGALAMRRDRGKQTREDEVIEQEVESILWAATQIAQEHGNSHASARMYRRMPWSRQGHIAVVHVPHEKMQAESKPDIALSS